MRADERGEERGACPCVIVAHHSVSCWQVDKDREGEQRGRTISFSS